MIKICIKIIKIRWPWSNLVKNNLKLVRKWLLDKKKFNLNLNLPFLTLLSLSEWHQAQRQKSQASVKTRSQSKQAVETLSAGHNLRRDSPQRLRQHIRSGHDRKRHRGRLRKSTIPGLSAARLQPHQPTQPGALLAAKDHHLALLRKGQHAHFYYFNKPNRHSFFFFLNYFLLSINQTDECHISQDYISNYIIWYKLNFDNNKISYIWNFIIVKKFLI